MPERLTPGALTVFANYSRQFSMPISMISQQMSTVFAALAGAERVFNVMDQEPEQLDAPDASAMPEMRGDVRLEHVSFGYNPDKTVLKDITLYAAQVRKSRSSARQAPAKLLSPTCSTVSMTYPRAALR